MVRTHEPISEAGVSRGAGIHRLAVPTPFAVGAVNVYLIEDEPLTLVDCGPNSATAPAALEGWEEWSARDDDLAHDLMLRHGLEPRAAKALRAVGWGAPARMDVRLADGDVLPFAGRSLWGDVAIMRAYLTLSEILGHLDLLIDAGPVAEDGFGPVTRFEAV